MKKKKVAVRVAKNGVITVKSENRIASKRVGTVKPEEMYEIIRWMVLDAGMVFSDDISKMAKKILGL